MNENFRTSEKSERWNFVSGLTNSYYSPLACYRFRAVEPANIRPIPLNPIGTNKLVQFGSAWLFLITSGRCIRQMNKRNIRLSSSDDSRTSRCINMLIAAPKKQAITK